MTFQEAVEKLRVMHKGKARKLGFSLWINEDGTEYVTCDIFIHGGPKRSQDVLVGPHPTWEEAFLRLEIANDPPPLLSQAP